MHHYCLITDKNYINSTICLINKILPKKIHVLCLDNYSENFFYKNFKNLSTYKLKIIEEKYDLLKIKFNRSKRSYIFTLKSFFLDYLKEFINPNEYLIYLDSDLYFFSETDIFEKIISDAAVHITPHNFDNKNNSRIIYGNYNAGVVIFRNNIEGMKVLHWWKNKCYENCSLDVSEKIYSDQKYLNDFHKISQDIIEIDNPGINLAPWNLNNYNYEIIGNRIYVNKNPLVLFHFHSFKKLLFSFYAMGIKDYFVSFNDIVNFVYKEYVFALNQVLNKYPELKENNLFHFKTFIKSLIKNDIKKI